MDIKEFAKSISGKEYGYPQFTKEEIETAKENGFVIVYGASDDLMEFEGAIQDEGGCFDGGKVYFNKIEVCQDETDRSAFDNYSDCITALWCEKEENGKPICWSYETEITHETFMIYEGGHMVMHVPYDKPLTEEKAKEFIEHYIFLTGTLDKVGDKLFEEEEETDI